METMLFENSAGLEFLVLLLNPGESGPYPAAKDDTHSIVEFYDTRYPHTEHGQFVSRYRLDDIMPGYMGLNLDGGVEAWSVDAETMNLIRAWLREWWVQP